MVEGAMRLDRFLWFVRLARTRSAAQSLVDTGRFRIAGRAVDRAAAPVRVGDVLTFVQAGAVRVIRIAALPSRRGPAAEAQACYDNVSQEARDELTLPAPPHSSGHERPIRGPEP